MSFPPPLPRIPLDRVIEDIPPPFLRSSTPYVQSRFSPASVDYASREGRSLSSFKLAKMILVGDCGVGKTALVHRFCRNAFDANYKATIGVDFEVERFDVMGVRFNLQIWDTAGQERFKCIAKSYYRDANVIFVVFDLSDAEKTLEGARRWLEDALEANLMAAAARAAQHTHHKGDAGCEKPLVFLSDESYSSAMSLAASAASAMDAELWAVSSKAREQQSAVTELFRRASALAFDRGVAGGGGADGGGGGRLRIGGEGVLDKKDGDVFQVKKPKCSPATNCQRQ